MPATVNVMNPGIVNILSERTATDDCTDAGGRATQEQLPRRREHREWLIN
jgi:protein involved in polysaccharide export with SLBB domain